MRMRATTIALSFTCLSFLAAQNPKPAAELAKANIIVTAGHFTHAAVPPLSMADLKVAQRFIPVPITRLSRLDNSIELFVLVDNCADCARGPNFDDLRKFLRAQPPNTLIGVAYATDGNLRIAEPPTPDRERAVKALNPPSGASHPDPFGPLAELIRTWRPNASRHVILMITNGVDPATTDLLECPHAEAAIDAAQWAGVTVFSIYNPAANYLESDIVELHAGQVQLAHVADETGGEAYFLNFGPLPSMAPFLADIAEHLANQYVLEVLLNPGMGWGEFQDITVNSNNSDLQIMAPTKVWVPGRPSGD